MEMAGASMTDTASQHTLMPIFFNFSPFSCISATGQSSPSAKWPGKGQKRPPFSYADATAARRPRFFVYFSKKRYGIADRRRPFPLLAAAASCAGTSAEKSARLFRRPGAPFRLSSAAAAENFSPRQSSRPEKIVQLPLLTYPFHESFAPRAGQQTGLNEEPQQKRIL